MEVIPEYQMVQSDNSGSVQGLLKLKLCMKRNVPQPKSQGNRGKEEVKVQRKKKQGKQEASKGNNHKTRKVHSCEECSKTFHSKKAMESHSYVHTGERPFVCSQCGKAFTRAVHLRDHKTLHTGEKRFVCSECGKNFTVNSSLKVHMLTHTGEKPHMCNECGRCFTRSSDMLKHLRGHRGVRPFVCCECGKTFVRGQHLESHMDTQHRNVKRHSCTQCNRTFYRSVQLEVHLCSQHTGERLPHLSSQHTGERLPCLSSQHTEESLPHLGSIHTGESQHLGSHHTGESPHQSSNHTGESLPHLGAIHTGESLPHLGSIHTGERLPHLGSNHTGESPHLSSQHTGDRQPHLACYICGRGFPVNASLEEHLKAHYSITGCAKKRKKNCDKPKQQKQKTRNNCKAIESCISSSKSRSNNSILSQIGLLFTKNSKCSSSGGSVPMAGATPSYHGNSIGTTVIQSIEEDEFESRSIFDGNGHFDESKRGLEEAGVTVLEKFGQTLAAVEGDCTSDMITGQMNSIDNDDLSRSQNHLSIVPEDIAHFNNTFDPSVAATIGFSSKAMFGGYDCFNTNSATGLVQFTDYIGLGAGIGSLSTTG